MDVQMPRLDGFQATAAIRAAEVQTGRRIPIIAMTAHAMKGDRERCLAAGMDGYIPKPIRAERFLSVVEGWPVPSRVKEAPGEDGDRPSEAGALLARDPRTLERAGHRLKGSAGSLSACRVVTAAQRLEELGRDGDLDQVEPVRVRLEQELVRFENALNVWERGNDQ
jgi:DNA-binding response OmpR family regulator